MVDVVFDEIVAAAEILAVEAMSITELFYEGAEAAAEFLVEAVAWMMRFVFGATAGAAEF
jgi:hypothetical protein